MARYQERLLRTGEDGKTVESAGPIVWGTRLASSQMPQAWQAITYEKGSWILHMLRHRLGDAAFRKLLGELTRRYAMAPLTNGDLQRLAAELMPGGNAKSNGLTMAAFFDTWVYGTGVPEVKLQSKVTATRAGVVVTGTVTQSGVGEEFTAEVPVEISLGRGRTMTQWVKTASDPVEFTVKLPPGTVAAQVKAAMDPAGWVLRR
jgi:aminopeptidase N